MPAVFLSTDSIQIGGTQPQSLDIQIQQPGDYFGIRFYPGALRYFFKLNLSEITGQFVDSHYFPCEDFAYLNEAVYQHSDFHTRAQICEQWLLQHYAPQPTSLFDKALALIYRFSGNIEVNYLAEKTGASSRHLNRLFQQHTGLSTKAFAQVIRIQSACKRLYQQPDQSLTVADTLGFFDQAHLLREYKRHLGLNPRALSNRFMSDLSNPKKH